MKAVESKGGTTRLHVLVDATNVDRVVASVRQRVPAGVRENAVSRASVIEEAIARGLAIMELELAKEVA